MNLLHEVVAGAGLTFWAEAALVMFLTAFLAVLWWVYGVRRAADYDQVAALPLDEDDSKGPGEGPVAKERE